MACSMAAIFSMTAVTAGSSWSVTAGTARGHSGVDGLPHRPPAPADVDADGGECSSHGHRRGWHRSSACGTRHRLGEGPWAGPAVSAAGWGPARWCARAGSGTLGRAPGQRPHPIGVHRGHVDAGALWHRGASSIHGCGNVRCIVEAPRRANVMWTDLVKVQGCRLTPGLSRARKRERSARWRASAPGLR
jgi:hypothetical protein